MWVEHDENWIQDKTDGKGSDTRCCWIVLLTASLSPTNFIRCYSEAGRHARDRSWPALPSTDICYGQPHGGCLWEATSETTSNCC